MLDPALCLKQTRMPLNPQRLLDFPVLKTRGSGAYGDVAGVLAPEDKTSKGATRCSIDSRFTPQTLETICEWQ